MDEKEKLEKTDKLINFLVDGGEFQNGMYLAAAYQYLIGLQKEFLNPILEANLFSGILNSYVNSLSKTVPIQEAKKEQIVLIEERFKNYKKYSDFNDVVYAYSERNIFGENGKINYSGYNTFVYDYDRIEEELGKIILPGVCLFEGEDELNFVTYWGEGFRGGNSSMISKVYSKYPQKDLNDEEKKEVINYISSMNKTKMAQGDMKTRYDFKNFFGSLQILLFYLTEKGVVKEGEKIINIINNSPGYLKISNDFENFFKNEGKNLTVNKIMNLFFFFEHLCFEDLSETLQPEYKAQIPDKTKTVIIEKLLKQKNENDIIPTKSLAAATRRMISRYLAGKRAVTDIGEDRDLTFELCREELWEEKIGQLEDLMDFVIVKMNGIKLNVGQAFEFYNIIGEEDKNAININYQNEIKKLDSINFKEDEI